MPLSSWKGSRLPVFLRRFLQRGESNSMKKCVVLVLIFSVGLLLGAAATTKTTNGSGVGVVLPNSKLIGCKGPECSQLWQDLPSDEAAIYPHNINIDIEDGAVMGVIAHYDKSISVNSIRSSIDSRYGKSTYVIDNETSPVKVWRVEPERIAIQLAVENNGMKQVIYLSAKAWDKWKKP